jgi:hypothetical protein
MEFASIKVDASKRWSTKIKKERERKRERREKRITCASKNGLKLKARSMAEKGNGTEAEKKTI